MRIAIISDIHANLPALKAVLHDMKQYKPDSIFCLGDLVNFAGWDNETIELIRDNNITTVLGNHDEGIGKNLSDFPFSFKTEARRTFGLASIQYVNRHITDANRNYLAGLPFSVCLNFQSAAHPINITLAHGSVYANTEYITKAASESYFLEMLTFAKSDIIVMGHTHIPFHRKISVVNGNSTNCLHIINAGSVGKPKHGDNRACYTLININPRFDLCNPAAMSVQFNFVPYDVEAVVEHLRQIGLSDAYDSFLRSGH